MKTRLMGPLGELMARHLQLRRSLGYQLRTDEISLDEFDAYVSQNFPNCHQVTRAMVTGYLKAISGQQLVSRRKHLTTIRQFCRFLFQLDPETYIPEPYLLPAAASEFKPHLYALAEVNDLMKAALRLPPGRLPTSAYLLHVNRITLGIWPSRR